MNEPNSLGLVIPLRARSSAISVFRCGEIIKPFSGSALLRLAFTGASLGTLAMSLLPPLPILLIAAFLLGLSWGPFNPFLNSLIQQRVSSENQAQVFGAQTAFFYAAPPLGMVIAGLAVETFGIATAYQSLAWALMLTSVIALATPALREKF